MVPCVLYYYDCLVGRFYIVNENYVRKKPDIIISTDNKNNTRVKYALLNVCDLITNGHY